MLMQLIGSDKAESVQTVVQTVWWGCFIQAQSHESLSCSHTARLHFGSVFKCNAFTQRIKPTVRGVRTLKVSRQERSC